MAAGRSPPVVTSALIGRTEQDHALRDLLFGHPSRLVTLTGPPGVGKTRLAIALATGVEDGSADMVAWVDLGPVRDPVQVPVEIALSLGIRSAGYASPVDAVVSAVADRTVLLVVDNCEHLLDAAPVIGELLERLPRLRVLATSRQRLHLLAEVEYPLPPLPVPAAADTGDLAVMADNPAVELLLARAPAHVALNSRSAEPLAQICLRLDGLPLALELAAARLRVFTPSELAFRLEHRTAGLSAMFRDAPARHRTLVTAIDWSHTLLPEAERTAFRRLAVLAGGWTLDAAEAVCGMSFAATLAAIDALLDHSLIQRIPSDGPARFTMLASIHDFAVERLEASGDVDATRDRHAHYFAGVAEAWEATIGTDAENATWDEFDAIQPDMAAAFDHHGPGPARAWLGIALAWYAYIHGSMTQAATVLDGLHDMEQLPTTGAASDSLDDETRTAALVACGVLEVGCGELARAEQDLREAIALSGPRSDVRHRAVATSFLGHVARGLGRADEAAQQYGAARSICAGAGHVRGMAWAAFDLGLLAADADSAAERAAAEPLLREALTYFEYLGYDWAWAQSARGLATALLDGGDVDEAGKLLGRSLLLHDRAGDRRGGAQCLEALADVAATRGSLATAARLIGAARTQRELGATTPTESEQRRLDDVSAKITATLGRPANDHEKHNGRTAARSVVLGLAAEVAEAGPTRAAAEITLTSRQLQVAELVAGGRTNRQVGRALGISEKTAEIHVSNIMARLEVPNRAGVASWVATHRPSAG